MENAKNAFVFFIIFMLVLFALSIIAAALYSLKIEGNLIALGSVATEFSFLLSVLVYMSTYKGMSRNEIISALGIGKGRLSLRNVGLGIAIFMIMLMLSYVVGIVSTVTNTKISTNTQLILASEPLWFYVFMFTLTPFCEEILFRGLMVPRIGIVISAILFGLGHANYGSTFGIDIIAAFIFGVIAGWAFKRTKSLYPSMIAHGLVNLLAVAAYIF